MHTNIVGVEKETDNVQEMRRKQIMYTNNVGVEKETDNAHNVGDEKETDNAHKHCRR